MSCCNSNCNHDPCGSSFNQALTRAAQYAQYAQTQANKAEDLWLEFNALYLGAFAVAPTQDNEGNPLQVGALYWNTGANELYAWNGLAWVTATGFNEFTPFLSTGSTTPRNLATRMADVVNVKDFGAVGDGVTDDTAAIQAALNFVSFNFGSILFTPGNYKFSSTISIPERCGIFCDPNVFLTYTGIANNVIVSNRGVNFVGNGVVIKCTNPNWNGTILYIDGTNRYASDYPASFDGINCVGNTTTKGTGLGLWAENATNFISFVRFSNFTFYTLNYGLTINCGNSGNPSDASTWHWINGNVFENFYFFGTTFGMTALGTSSTPAEVAGNIFNNFEFQVSNTPVYTSGPSRNYFNNVYIWDWDFSVGNPVIFNGTSIDNQFNGNIDPLYVTGYSNNGVWHLGVNLFTKIIADGDIWCRGTNNIKIGYAGIEAKINGANQLILTPRSGYNTQIASELVPTTDNSYSLGSSSNRWSVVYAATGAINTSDEREKTFLSIEDSEKLAALEIKQNLRKFKFNSAIQEKGEIARIHFGASAQQVGDIMKSHGLDPNKYGFYCYDEWDEIQEVKDNDGNIIQEYRPAGNRYGLRYEELLAFIISAI